MEFIFIETSAEGNALYASVMCYLLAIVIVLPGYLKIIRNKKLDSKQKQIQIKKVKRIALISLLSCALIHIILFHWFHDIFPEEGIHSNSPRSGYYLSIGITFTVFSIFMWFGMFLRGTSTLPKHEGPVTGV